MRKLYFLLIVSVLCLGTVYSQGRPGGGGRGPGGGRSGSSGGPRNSVSTPDYPDVYIPQSTLGSVHVYAYDFTDDGRTNWLYENVYSSITYEVFTYNENDLLTEKTAYPSYSPNRAITTTYEYDDNGNLIKETESDPSYGETTVTYTYDAGGNLLSEHSSAYNNITTYQYDEDGNLIHESWGGDAYIEMEYDSDGNLIYDKYAWGWGNDEWNYYSYDSSGNLSYVTNYETLDQYEFMTYSKYYYDSEGRLSKIYYVDPDYYYSTTYYEYDDDGNLIAEELDDGWGDDWNQYWTYNADGTTNTYKSGLYEVYYDTTDYEYDDDGNLIKMTTYNDYEVYDIYTFEYDENGYVTKIVNDTAY